VTATPCEREDRGTRRLTPTTKEGRGAFRSSEAHPRPDRLRRPDRSSGCLNEGVFSKSTRSGHCCQE
jgi:hypothetical protein